METKPTKAIVAGIGATLTALATLWATVSIAYESNGIDIGEYGTILTAVLACVGTVRAVWATTNHAKPERPPVVSVPREDYTG